MTKSTFRWMFAFVLVASVIVAVGATWVYTSQKPLPPNLVAEYVGRECCIQCHAKEAELYKGSHHDLAMDIASESTVLGDFSGAQLEHYGVVSTMFKRDGKFWVNTEGPDGAMRDFEIKYVFGVTPLQQYMVEIEPAKQSDSSAVGQVQVLRVSWDTKSKKWFHLDPPDVHERIEPNDDLHWTGVAQRWNTMCAECHSTNLVKGFDVPTGTYHTTFSEIDVSCEACHGPGSIHTKLANQTFGKWKTSYGTGLAPLKASAQNQIEACAPCHSRRQIVADGFHAGKKFDDHYTDNLLVRDVYFADGQVQDEDYIHGSFIQSKMYHKGIRCTDCHDPHSARLKQNGNQVCTSCHQHPAAKYDSVAHHFHTPGKPGSACIDCHMPPTTYMDVDPRHDHSIRIPRPDLSVRIGTPNACTGCHIDKQKLPENKRDGLRQYVDWMAAGEKSDEEVKAELRKIDEWADAACEKWYGENRRRDVHFGEALQAGRRKEPAARDQLVALLARRGEAAPAIARATALHELLNVDLTSAAIEARRNLKDESPMVRAAAIAATGAMRDPGRRVLLLQPLLKDPVRSVRIEAARGIAETGTAIAGQINAADYQAALIELEQSLLAMRERAGAHVSLGALDEQHQRFQAAVKHYEDAIRIEPTTVGPRTNLAALLERLAADTQAQSTANADVSVVRNAKELAEKLRERAKSLRAEELPLLERDARLLPSNAHLQYRLGLAQYLAGDLTASVRSLSRALELAPGVEDYYVALALLYEKQGDLQLALDTVKKGLVAIPDSGPLREVEQQLKSTDR
jgi:predicted CXXCH cytochrome family protein